MAIPEGDLVDRKSAGFCSSSGSYSPAAASMSLAASPQDLNTSICCQTSLPALLTGSTQQEGKNIHLYHTANSIGLGGDLFSQQWTFFRSASGPISSLQKIMCQHN